LNLKLVEAEEKSKKAISMAQQTKRGHVYIISNIGSFGDDVYKIGLTRRLDPNERVRELGDASVPFPFDIHAVIASEDAPALETALHKQFVERQVNKVNRRKEFFRVSLTELRKAVDELRLESTWTLTAEAAQYRETLALEHAMKTNAELKRRWLDEQKSFDPDDESLDAADRELEEIEA
jgi:T5orf172 domain